jgi:hypothetical protein
MRLRRTELLSIEIVTGTADGAVLVINGCAGARVRWVMPYAQCELTLDAPRASDPGRGLSVRARQASTPTSNEFV